MCHHDPNCCELENGACFCDHTIITFDGVSVPDCESCPHNDQPICVECGTHFTPIANCKCGKNKRESEDQVKK